MNRDFSTHTPVFINWKVGARGRTVSVSQTVPIQDMSHKAHLLIGLCAIALAPFATWGMVVIAARIWKARLLRILPWLRTLSWGVWGIGVLLFLIAVVQQHFWITPFAAITASSSFVFGQVGRWVKRRYAPELLPREFSNGVFPQG